MALAEMEGRTAPRPRWDRWTTEDHHLLRDLAGTRPIDEVATEISRVSGVPRTVNAVAVMVTRLGISRWTQGLSMRDMERIFGLHHKSLVSWWIEPGLIQYRRWNGRGRSQGWWFEERDVEAFIRTCPWAYDWTRMQPGHRLTHLAEVVNRLDPWLTIDEAAPLIGRCTANIHRWVQRGVVPHKRRGSVHGVGMIMLRSRDLREIAETISAAADARYRDALRRGQETRQARARARREGMA